MELYNQLMNKLKDQRGAVAVIVAILVFFVLIGIMALAIDVGRLYTTKNELQNVADSAALAGAGLLGQIYTNMNISDQQTYNCTQDTWSAGTSDCESIRDRAQDVGGTGKNPVGGEDITIDSGDVIIGKWDGDSLTCIPTNGHPNPTPDAVRVIARRDSSLKSAEGPITTFFAKIFGINTADVSADATAALLPIGEVGPGKMNMPVGLSESWFEPNPNCEDTIAFSPTPTSCAGWHNFFDPINANAMSNKLLGFILDDPTVHDDISGNDPDPYGDCVLEPCGRTDPLNSSDVSWIDEFNGGKLAWEADPLDPDGNLVIPTYNTPGDPTSGQVVLDDDKHPAPFFAIFDYFRFRDEIDIGAGVSVDTNGDGTDDKTFTDPDAVWSGLVPVYKDPNPCINPNTALEIVGFAIIHVVMPNGPPDSTILAKIDCEMRVIEGQGGGGTSGSVKANIPKLVE